VIINPFDEYAIEEALRIKETNDAKTLAICYGTDSAETALRSAMAIGLEEAYLVSNPDFEQLDPQQAAAVLAKAIKKIGDIDIILTGKQATDDDSAMVAPAVAGYLDIPQVGFVKKFETVSADKVTCFRSTEDGYDQVDVPLPAVFSVVKEINEPRLPSLKGKMKAKKAKITKWTLSDLGLQPDSKITIKSINEPPARPSGEILTGEKDEIIDKLVSKLKEQQLI